MGDKSYKRSKQVSKETYDEAKADIKDIKGKVHSIKGHKEEGEKRLKTLRKKADWSFPTERTLKAVYKDRDKGWGKDRNKIEHNAKGGRVGMTRGGGVGVQTHGNKLAKALNTQTPKFSSYINEDGYYKGGIKIRS